jgi:rhamnogalacturonyl hydrolase YesR
MNARTVLPLFLAVSAFQPPLQANAAIDAATDPRRILTTMKKVADWHLAQPPKRAVDDWTYGAFYAGLSALSQISDDSKHHDALVTMGRKQEWKPGKRIYDADDHCVTQTYLDLYLQHRDPAMLAPTKSEFDSILANPKTNDLRFDIKGARDRWAWCDSLFMGPPAWVRLYEATSDKKYLAFVDREWRATSDFLYDKEEHLYYRDSTYFEKREANGKKIFWSRGNGWVLAGLARVLQVMPPEHSNRKFYQQQYREMAQKIASLQQPDGLWHSSLLDPASYPLKETSGSGFYTFALAWGINRGALDRATYEPVVRKSWQALLQCVNPEGKLSSVQPIGADPKTFNPENSEVFGAGAFLLAGSEMYRMALSDLPAAAYAAFMPQRKDDFAWENDRIGFRVYGPALEATGEISSGLDVWVKRTRKPIIEKWFYLADYHKDHGEGLDMYKVGPARGCGGTGIWRDGKAYVANNFITWRIVENGPSRVTFELTYAPYDAAGIKIRETRLISLETGMNLNRIENRFDWDGGSEELQAIVGIVKRPGGGPPDFAKDGSWMAYWEPEQKGNGTIGCGAVMTSPAQSVDTPEQAFLRTTVKRGRPLVYYAGAGWTKSGDFPSKELWVNYVSDAARKLAPASR